MYRIGEPHPESPRRNIAGMAGRIRQAGVSVTRATVMGPLVLRIVARQARGSAWSGRWKSKVKEVGAVVKLLGGKNGTGWSSHQAQA